jgi:hypothetical protein
MTDEEFDARMTASRAAADQANAGLNAEIDRLVGVARQQLHHAGPTDVASMMSLAYLGRKDTTREVVIALLMALVTRIAQQDGPDHG